MRARGFRRLPLEQRWDPKGEFGLEAMNGLPWDLETRERAAPVAAGQEEERREIVVPYAASPQPQAQRKRYVLQRDLEQHGYTEGCHAAIASGSAKNARAAITATTAASA